MSRTSAPSHMLTCYQSLAAALLRLEELTLIVACSRGRLHRRSWLAQAHLECIASRARRGRTIQRPDPHCDHQPGSNLRLPARRRDSRPPIPLAHLHPAPHLRPQPSGLPRMSDREVAVLIVGGRCGDVVRTPTFRPPFRAPSPLTLATLPALHPPTSHPPCLSLIDRSADRQPQVLADPSTRGINGLDGRRTFLSFVLSSYATTHDSSEAR